MSRYRRIATRLWADEHVRALSAPRPSGRFLWIYLLTGPHTTSVPGLFRVRLGGLAEELGWSRKALERCWRELEAKPMLHFDDGTGLVYIPRALAYNPPESPNVVRSWRAVLSELPEGDLLRRALAEIREGLAEMLGEAFVRAFDEATGSVRPRLPVQTRVEEPAEAPVETTLEVPLRTFRQHGTEPVPQAAQELEERRVQADLLVLDGLTLPLEPGEWLQERLGYLLGTRYDEERATLVTDPLPPGELALRLPLLASRLLEGRDVAFTGPDRRLAGAVA
jgi:hypothetical protein